VFIPGNARTEHFSCATPRMADLPGGCGTCDVAVDHGRGGLVAAMIAMDEAVAGSGVNAEVGGNGDLAVPLPATGNVAWPGRCVPKHPAGIGNGGGLQWSSIEGPSQSGISSSAALTAS
jgi:hypothetical protein